MLDRAKGKDQGGAGSRKSKGKMARGLYCGFYGKARQGVEAGLGVATLNSISEL